MRSENKADASSEPLPKLADLVDHIDELPLLPNVVVRLIGLDQHDENYFEDVTALASEDPPLAAQLIKIANSPMSAPAEPIVSIASAVTRLGAQFVASLVTSLAVTRVFVPTNNSQKRLWVHSINTALGARLITRSLPTIAHLNEAAYLAGLLHDIGRFIMFEQTPELLQQVEETHWATPDELLEVELKNFRFNHSELGYLAAKKWSFPNMIAETIRNHHVRFRIGQSGLPHQTEWLLMAVVTADCLAATLLDRPDFAEMEDESVAERVAGCLRPEWQLLPIDQEFLMGSLAEIHDGGQQLARHLGVL
ncbi:MAG: HDOD domain-containing protein [Gammaproteobacteria bacterium]|nr:HDOD domain-containing protein [Gammaproteobacteria bacterium]